MYVMFSGWIVEDGQTTHLICVRLKHLLYDSFLGRGVLAFLFFLPSPRPLSEITSMYFGHSLCNLHRKVQRTLETSYVINILFLQHWAFYEFTFFWDGPYSLR